jgi:hypothetical protein
MKPVAWIDLADDERSQKAVGYALKKAAEAWEKIIDV